MRYTLNNPPGKLDLELPHMTEFPNMVAASEHIVDGSIIHDSVDDIWYSYKFDHVTNGHIGQQYPNLLECLRSIRDVPDWSRHAGWLISDLERIEHYKSLVNKEST